MPKVFFTSSFVKSLVAPKDIPKLVFIDEKTKGLMLEVRSSGGKTYYLKYVDDRGHTRQIKLSDFDDVTLTQARKIAKKFNTRIALGEDLLEQKKIYRSIPTFDEFIYQHYIPYIQSYKRSWKSDECYLRSQILPAIGKKYLDEISKAEVANLLNTLKRKGYKPGTCNRSLVLIRYAFNLALRWKIPGVKTNPANDVPLFDDLEGKRERYLSEMETLRLFESVNQSENSMLKYIVAMLVLTGARKREVLDARWNDLDIKNQQWRIPITKAGRPRYVPLSKGVLVMLKDIPRDSSQPFVFPNPKTGKPYREIFKSWDTARTKAGLSDVRMHDLRHSFASFLVNAGRSLYEVQRILGHTQIKTTQRYAHLSQDTLVDAANAAASAICSKQIPLWQ